MAIERITLTKRVAGGWHIEGLEPTGRTESGWGTAATATTGGDDAALLVVKRLMEGLNPHGDAR